jgi:hypothetical protein
VDPLDARDLLKFKFEERRTVPDQDFNDHIKRKHANCAEGHQTNSEDLMLLADNELKLRSQSPRNGERAQAPQPITQRLERRMPSRREDFGPRS